MRASRDYMAAVTGRTSEADRAQIETTLSSYTRIDPVTIREMVPAPRLGTKVFATANTTYANCHGPLGCLRRSPARSVCRVSVAQYTETSVITAIPIR